MKFELKMDKEQLMEIGKGAGKIGKSILVEGTKAVALKSAHAAITQVFDRESGGVGELKLDDYLRGGKKKETKGGLFSFKKKVKEDGEILETEVEVEFAREEDVTVRNPDEDNSKVINPTSDKVTKTKKAK